MIKIIDDWYITVETNPTNYVVRRGNGEKDKKNSWIDKPRGFYGSLRNAIKGIREQVIADRLKDGSRTLSEAFRTISDIDTRFEEILKKVNA